MHERQPKCDLCTFMFDTYAIPTLGRVYGVRASGHLITFFLDTHDVITMVPVREGEVYGGGDIDVDYAYVNDVFCRVVDHTTVDLIDEDDCVFDGRFEETIEHWATRQRALQAQWMEA